MDEVRVLAPASVSNVVCGFDCLGFALAEPFDEVTVRKTDKRTVRIHHLDDFGLPTDPDKNVAGVALLAMLQTARLDFGFEVQIRKGIKPGSGIGSSAASSCGAVVAANRILGDRFSKNELLAFAMEGERLASGAPHADNVAPCIFGGFTLVRSVEPLDIVSLEFSKLCVTVIHPQIEIRTSDARALLPRQVPLPDAIRQWSNLGAFVAALSRNDNELLSRSMEDLIVEPARKSLIPKFDEIKAVSLGAGAIGGGISGSGPSIFMLSTSLEIASKISGDMRSVFEPTGIDFKIYSSEISRSGARVLEPPIAENPM
jgi:homoserine kinase